MKNQWAGLLDRSRDVILNRNQSPQRGQIMMKLEEDQPELMNAIRQQKYVVFSEGKNNLGF